MERKKQLRKWIAQEKKKYSDSTLKALSEKVLTTLEAYPEFQKGHTILLYHSMKDEVQTHAFIEKWSRSKKIILPVVIGDELELRVYTGPQIAAPKAGICFPFQLIEEVPAEEFDFRMDTVIAQ